MRVIGLNPLNINNFDDTIKGKCIILFHHPQCGHCNELKPIWEKVKEMNTNKPINIVEISADMLNKLNHPIQNSVQGFPQIVRLENGKVIEEFNKMRNVENLNKFINKNIIKNKNINHSLNTNKVKKPRKKKEKTKKKKKKKKKN